MSRSRSRGLIPPWAFVAAPLFALVVGSVLVHGDHPTAALTFLLVFGGGFIALVAVDGFVVTPRRSRALRARLTPADLAAAVDPATLAAAAGEGRPKDLLAAAHLVQDAFPGLSPADALDLVRATYPGLLPPRGRA